MAAWGLFVLLLTTLPGTTPLVHDLSAWIGDSEDSGMVGHMGLFAILTLLTWRVLARQFDARRAILLAMILALLLGTTTEFLQWFVFARNASFSDLVANWFGVFIVGFIILYAHHPRATRARR